MKNTMIAMFLALAMCACASTGGSPAVSDATVAKSVAYSCEAAATALDALAVAKRAGKVSASLDAQVLQVAARVTPVCHGGQAMPTYDSAKLMALAVATAELQSFVLEL